MKLSFVTRAFFALLLTFFLSENLLAQPPRQRPPRGEDGGRLDGPPQGDQRGQRVPDRAEPAIMKALDANSDGVVSADEIENAVAALKTLDKNSDGQLERSEMFPARSGGRPPRDGRPQGQGSRPPSRDTPDSGAQPNRRNRDAQPSDRGNSESRLDSMVTRFMNSDADGDGLVSKSELPPQLRDRMMAADKDEDGSLSKEEIQSYMQSRIEAWDKRKAETGDSNRGNDKVDSPPERDDKAAAEKDADSDKSNDSTLDRRQLSGQPLGIRVMDDLDALVVTGNEEDVKAITEAIEKALKELNAKKGSDKK